MEEYIIDSFTRTGDQTNLEVNNLNVTCITSRNNKFNLDSEGNLTVKSIITADSNSPLEELVDLIYPIGSIYLSVNASSPNTLFGGTWEQIKDKFLLSSGDTYTAGATGGEATHILTVSELPSHNHAIGKYWNTAAGGNATMGSNATGSGLNNNTGVGLVGDNQPHNNMPPYLVVNVWKRIA